MAADELTSNSATEGIDVNASTAMEVGRAANERPPARRQQSVGTLLAGRYRIRRLLGEGGCGQVFEAEDSSTGASVAVKTIQPEVMQNREMVLRFLREAEILSRIESPHIARIYGAGVDPATGTQHIAMEYLSGLDFDALLERTGRIPADLALAIAAQVLRGLLASHAAGVVHRDIKPKNIFLVVERTGTVTVKLLDFGIALAPDASANGPLTGTGVVGFGSAHYISPEQWKRPHDVDERADIWSLGVTLFEAITGRLPSGPAETMFELMSAICQHEAPRLSSLVPKIDPHTDSLVAQALRIDSNRRFQSAAAMLRAIDHVTRPTLQAQRLIELWRDAEEQSEHKLDPTGLLTASAQAMPGHTRVRFCGSEFGDSVDFDIAIGDALDLMRWLGLDASVWGAWPCKDVAHRCRQRLAPSIGASSSRNNDGGIRLRAGAFERVRPSGTLTALARRLLVLAESAEKATGSVLYSSM